MGQVTKERIREQALALGFEDVGFTGVEPLALYVQEIESRMDMYRWVNTSDFSTLRGANPATKHPWARSMMVVIRNYHRKAFPREMLGRFGRCYQVDERKRKGEEHGRFLALLEFLKAEGIQARFDGEVPARIAAARAGIVTYGKNCFVFARRSMKDASWLESIPLLLDAPVEPDDPTIEVSCPENCKDACIRACPTGALYAPLRMNPLRCIAFQTYYGPPMTPPEAREAMGSWVYGCDRCQEVCPRNRPWMRQTLPVNVELEARASDFELKRLLTMSQGDYEERVWPQFFYISRSRRDIWQMNAARALGNLGDTDAVPLMARAMEGSPFENVRAMCAWALGRIGGSTARSILDDRRTKDSGAVRTEIERALAAG